MEHIGWVMGVTIVLVLFFYGILDLLRLFRALFELPGQIINKAVEFLRRLRFR